MQPINFKGYVKVGHTYFDSSKITKITEYQKAAAPTVIYFDNGNTEKYPEITDTEKFVNLLNQANLMGNTLDYNA